MNAEEKAAVLSDIEEGVRNVFPEGKVKVNGHEFELRNLRNTALTTDEETSYFRHSHIGKDDRVFFAISVNHPETSYSAEITRIEFRGILKSLLGTKSLAVETAQSSDHPKAKVFAEIAEVIDKWNVQSKLDGDWINAAAEIVDLIGERILHASVENQKKMRLPGSVF